MSYEEKDLEVRKELIRVIGAIEKMLNEPTIIIDIFKIAFDKSLFRYIEDMQIRGLISGYIELMESECFQKSSQADKIGCLIHYQSRMAIFIEITNISKEN